MDPMIHQYLRIIEKTALNLDSLSQASQSSQLRK